MSIPRRAFVAALGLATLPALAQAFPTKPIRLVVTFPAGGAPDILARLFADKAQLGQAVVVDNKPGAGGNIGADFVAKSPADGYTLLIASPSSISVNPALNPKLGYRFADLQPVAKLTASPLVIAANPATGIASVKDLVAAAKKAPGKINYATSGNGSAQHLAAPGLRRAMCATRSRSM